MCLLQGFLSGEGPFQRTGLRSSSKCDMCEDEPPQEEPLCVQWCLSDALTYEEREEEGEEEEKLDEMEAGLESLVDRYGMEKVVDTVARISKKE